jgi:hypothetical protein
VQKIRPPVVHEGLRTWRQHQQRERIQRRDEALVNPQRSELLEETNLSRRQTAHAEVEILHRRVEMKFGQQRHRRENGSEMSLREGVSAPCSAGAPPPAGRDRTDRRMSRRVRAGWTASVEAASVDWSAGILTVTSRRHTRVVRCLMRSEMRSSSAGPRIAG